MTDALTDISWLALALALVATLVIGGVYFALLVPQAYLRVMGLTEAPAATPLSSVGPVVCVVPVLVAHAVLVTALDLTSVADAVVFALVTGLGYLVAMTFQIAINPLFPRPIRYGLLNAPYFLAVSLVSSLLLVLI